MTISRPSGAVKTIWLVADRGATVIAPTLNARNSVEQEFQIRHVHHPFDTHINATETPFRARQPIDAAISFAS